MSRWLAGVLIVAALTGLAACDGGRVTTAIDRADIALNLLTDGSVEVRETFVVRTGAGSASRFERVIRKEQADALFDLSATIDGRPAPQGRGAGQIRVETGHPTRVRFDFDPSPNETRTVTLQYRVAGVVSISGNRGHFSWEALPPRRRVDIADARIELTLPDRTVQYGPAGVAEAGWTVSEQPRGIVSVRRNPPRHEAVTIVADVSTTTMALAEPRWQFNLARGRELMPAFASGAIFILVIGAGVLWIVRFQYPPVLPAGDVTSGVKVTTSPVLQLTMARRPPRRGSADAPIAALVDLGGRGHIAIREDSDRRLTVMPGATKQGTLAHEEVLLHELWLQTSQSMPLRVLRGALVRNHRAFARAVADDLVSAGLADPDRIGVRSGLRAGGAAVLALAMVCVIIVGAWLGVYGPWPMAMPASIFVVGIALLINSEWFSILTPEGARQAAAIRMQLWAMRRGRLRDGDGARPADLARALPLAIAAGFGSRWQKAHAADLDDHAFDWITPAAGETRVDVLTRLLKRVG